MYVLLYLIIIVVTVVYEGFVVVLMLVFGVWLVATPASALLGRRRYVLYQFHVRCSDGSRTRRCSSHSCTAVLSCAVCAVPSVS